MNGSTASLPDATRLGRTALTVGDEPAMVEFYRDVVGLTVLTRASETTTLGVDGTPLLVLYHDPDASPRPRRGTGLYHNAFRLPSREALGDALNRIRDRWELDGASDHDVSEALYCTDPDGNGVELYRDRPRDTWTETANGELQIGSASLDLEALAADASGESATSAPAGTTVGHVHLEVSSIDESRAFYADQLGFDVMMDARPSALFLGAGGYHHHLGVNTWHHRTTPAEGGDRGLAWFELVVPSSDALETIRTRLEDAGVSVDDREDGLAVADPDGIAIRLVVEA